MPSPSLLRLLVLVLLRPPFTAPLSLSVHPTTLPRSGSALLVQWSGLPSPSPLDFLALYSPPSSPDRLFLGYLLLNSTPSWPSGSGSLRLPLVNLRTPYQLRLFRWTPDQIDPKHHDHEGNPLPVVRHRLAVSEEIRFASVNGPEQVHLSFTDADDEMRVIFVTGNGAEGFVRYGLDEGRMEAVVRTDVKRYERANMCDWPANSSTGWRDPGWVHDGVMRELSKGAKYYYKVGSDANGWSPTYSFVSRDNDSNETIAYLFGDMGTSASYATYRRTQEESKSTVKWILRDIADLGDKPSLVSHIGDISYARGYSWLWDEFFNQIEPIAARVPYHVAIGNHEYDWPQQPWRPSWSFGSYGTDGGGECGVPYSLKFHMPGNSSLSTGTGAPDTRNLYYSFNAGVVHFVYISTETDFLPGSAQYAFIKQDLETVDRRKTPYVIVQGHRPMYTTSNEIRDTPLRERMRQHLEPLLVDNNVTLALWGHVHRYERFCALRNFQCVGNSSASYPYGATVHVVIGMAGQDWQPIWTPLPTHTDRPIFPQPEISMYRGGEFGYTRLVATREKLTLTYIGNHDGQPHDMVEIISGLTPAGGGDSSPGPSAALVRDDQNSSVKAASTKIAMYFELSYAKYAGFLMLGALGGYALGFILRSKRSQHWTPVKSEET